MRFKSTLVKGLLPWLLWLVVGAAHAVTATWQLGKQVGNVVTPEANVSAGNLVNLPDPTGPQNRLRIVVGGLPGNVTVTKISLYRDAFWFDSFNPRVEDLVLAGNTGPNSDWVVPPNPQGPIMGLLNRHAAIYCVVKLSDGSSVRSATIFVPKQRIVAEALVIENAAQFGGAVAAGTPAGVSPVAPNIRARVKVGLQRFRAYIAKSGALDPDVSASLSFLTPLPAGWSVSLSPSTVTLAPDSSADIELLVSAPSAGSVTLVVNSVSNGVSDQTEPLLLVAENDSSAGGDVPLPPWSIALLALSFSGLMFRRHRLTR